jgi:hypothetical protein
VTSTFAVECCSFCLLRKNCIFKPASAGNGIGVGLVEAVFSCPLSLSWFSRSVGVDDEHVQHEEGCYEELEDRLKRCRDH